MYGELRSEVGDRYSAFLEANGFCESHYEYNEQLFGNEILDLTSDQFAIRFVRDRSQIMINVRRRGGNWQPIDLVLARLGVHDSDAPSRTDFSTPLPSGFLFGSDQLVPNWPLIACLLST